MRSIKKDNSTINKVPPIIPPTQDQGSVIGVVPDPGVVVTVGVGSVFEGDAVGSGEPCPP